MLEESVCEDDSTSSEWGSSSFPISQGCNVVTPTIPIATTPSPEGNPVPLTIPTVPLWSVVPQPNTELFPKWLRDHQEEQQHVL
jgi:hypothetical protein